MEPESSLPQSQVPATCPYPEPARSSPYTHISHILIIHLNIIFPFRSGSPKWSFSFRFPQQNHVYTSTIPYTCNMPRSYHSVWCDHAKGSLRSSLCSFLHSPVTSSFLDSNILLSTLFSNNFSLRSFLNVSDQVSYPYKSPLKLNIVTVFKTECFAGAIYQLDLCLNCA